MYSRKSKKNNSPKCYTVGDKTYKTQALADLHKEWTADKIVYTFILPTISDKKIKNKFGALKASVNGNVFQSVMEAKYYVHLLHKEQEGVIKNIRLQVPFELVPSYKDNDGKKIRSVVYYADFCFETTEDNLQYIVDVKGKETPEFKIKWKLLGYEFPNHIRQKIQWSKTLNTWLTTDEIKKLNRQKGR